jgi:hypothetical protein
MELPRVASTATPSAVKGGATIISQWREAAMSGRNAWKKARVSAWFLYIFQFPAITGLRKSDLPVDKRSREY